MDQKHKKFLSLSIVFLVVLIAFGFGISSVSSRESNYYMDQVKTLIKNDDTAIDWVSVNEAIYKLGGSTDENVEEALIQVLRREKDITLRPGAPLPDVMPPLEMLKASSIISLEKMGSKKSIPEIKRIYDSTQHQVLRDIASEALKNLKNS